MRFFGLLGFIFLVACGGGGSPGASTPSASAPSTSMPSASEPPASEKPAHLGANLPAIFDWTRTPTFVDLINHARRFGSPATPWDEQATLGGDGWPVGDFGVILLAGQTNASSDAGTYKVSFKGRATVRPVSCDATVRNQLYDAARDLTTLDLVMVDGVYEHNLMLSFTATGPGIKNLKVIRPGYDAVNPPLFTRSFLDHIARFKTVRLMDWLRTNGNQTSSWAQRATPDNTHFASPAGVPWEHVVALANQGGKDIWINIPVRADDDYVSQLAKLLRSTLNGDAKIYLEYSNELWNGGFSQFGANLELARAELAANPGSNLAYDGSTDQYLIAFRRIARRAKEISDIFRGVYGDAAMMRTVRPVLAGQIVQPYIAQMGLDFINAVYAPPARYFYAVAGAPYFNLGSAQTTDGLSTDQVWQALDANLAGMATTNSMESNLAMTSWYGLKLLAYEGGPDTFGSGSIAAKKAINLDARMQTLCSSYLASWYANGGDMFMWFTAGAGNWDTQYGAWELTTDLALTDTPKIRCMDSVLGAPLPALAGRNQAPGTFDALAYAGNQPPYSVASETAVRYLHPGSSINYLVNAPQGGTYALVLSAQAGQAGNTVDVAVNARAVASGFALAAGALNATVDNAPIALPLSKGFNTLRLTTRTETSGYRLVALTIH